MKTQIIRRLQAGILACLLIDMATSCSTTNAPQAEVQKPTTGAGVEVDARPPETPPERSEPDQSVVLPDSSKKDAADVFAKGNVYYIWPDGTGPFKSVSRASKDGKKENIIPIPFAYIANGEPVAYQMSCNVELSRNAVMRMVQKETKNYSSKGKDIVEFWDALGFLHTQGVERGVAKVQLMDYATGKKPISNEITVDVER